MPESPNQILDELDVQVPTAGELTFNPEYSQGVKWNNSRYENDPNIGREEGDEFVWREDHREALLEAVQHGREQERRRQEEKVTYEKWNCKDCGTIFGLRWEPDFCPQCGNSSNIKSTEELEEEVEGLE